MVFNSISFMLYLPCVLLVCALISKYSQRVMWLLFSSYIFYMYWEPSYIVLILGSTVVDFFTGQRIYEAKNISRRRLFLFISLGLNLGLLFTFKYFNFFSSFVYSLFPSFFPSEKPVLLQVLLPVGISFYTFQTMSYSIDIYKGEQKPERNFFTFALFVSYFPQLVAGPIERSRSLLPQISKNIRFNPDNLSYFFRMFLWGMFKKIVIADNLASYVDLVFGGSERHSSLTLFIGSILFSMQIYCDFSGYSDIAIGTSRLFNIKLMDNFKTPYLARSMGEHWQRWHISLSTWFRDYVYIPLGGSRGGNLKTFRNIMITFVVSGIWHGANWTFVLWGGIHGLFVGVEKMIKIKINLPGFFRVLVVFLIANFAFIFFRADDIHHGWSFILKMLSFESASIYKVFELVKFFPYLVILAVVDTFLGTESIGEKLENISPKVRLIFYVFLSHFILQNGAFHGKSFIYFQF